MIRRGRGLLACLTLTLVALGLDANAQMAGASTSSDLVIVKDGAALAAIVVASDAGEMETLAAQDLGKYIEMMSGARPSLIVLAPNAHIPSGPAIVIGKAALAADRTLQTALARVAKKNPLTHADAIALRRSGNRVYLAGNNDRAHYFAVSKLLQEWGCRWYMPTEFGEVVPEHRTLSVGALEHVHGSPFEIRSYWLSWLADDTGKLDFQRRNFASDSPLPVFGHALGGYTKKLIPPGQTAFNVPLSEDATAIEVAAQVDAPYAKGVPGISLAIEDGIYTSLSQSDTDLQAGIHDKYMLAPSNTDAMLTLYNKVGRILRTRHPLSPTKIGGLAYANATIPPQRVLKVEPNVMMWLAPIDIDSNHGMDQPNAPSRLEYKAMMYRWSQILEGRLAIYDYDQGQLVWRDLPNPSHHAFAQDVQHYRKAQILGVSTESRGATATTFLNLFFRLQLMWNPDADIDAMLAEFYPKFYGPAAAPMATYWSAIYKAWRTTVATEHEYMVAPVIYTPELIETLRLNLTSAQAALAGLRDKTNLGRNERLYLERMRFTTLSFELIDSYLNLVREGAGNVSYPAAVAAGEGSLAARDALTAMNPTFTTYKKIGETGPAWLPGEVRLMERLGALTDGTKGSLLAKLPLQWAFRRDPHDTGLASGWAYTPAARLSRSAMPGALELDPAGGDPWELLRTDIYLQGQGVRHPDGQSFTGYYWYQTQIDLSSGQVSDNPHLMFPGLFNECWLYVNGELVAHRRTAERWWNSDYEFSWDVALEDKLKPGNNLITLRGRNPHHFGGMFRRPFLYRRTYP